MNTQRTNWLVWSAAALGAMAGRWAAAPRKHPRFSFRGKSVLITGGSRGLGLEMARLLVAEGALLTLVGRDADTLEVARMELDQEGTSILTISCDVRIREEAQMAVRRVIEIYGALDVLINNAGVIQVGPFDEMTIEDYENAMATHLWGPLYFALAAVPHMRRQGAGRIVNISSIGGRVGVPHMLPYSISKFALSGLSQALAAEVSGDGIIVTSVFPGMMRTGSHVNASFKGDYRREFAWFSIAAASPLLSMEARSAAAEIIHACRLAKKELILTPSGRLAVLMNTICPTVVGQTMAFANALLPGPSNGTDTAAHSGWESQSIWSPSPLTRRADQAVERNNENCTPNVAAG